MSSVRKLRCAVYTRKSSEEGLDQEFNSLDAQREACSAYIASQIGSGWTLVPEHYDDGGISGGTMERPALLRMLDDIRAKRVDVVVVYKIDRLTRSLTDFAKIVDVFDGNSVSFVSVTQAFNTTTSMGRLTLNVLLSFAQFEREVTAERIRDKIAASKAKGMWMGGHVPLGYQVINRKLIVKEPEAGFVRSLFTRYLELGSVPALAAAVTREAIAAECIAKEPFTTAEEFPDIAQSRFTRRAGAGMLYRLLANPIYIGKLKHHAQLHDGEHQPIIDVELFNKVQALLASNAVRPRGAHQRPHSQVRGHLLTGLLYDDAGDRMMPSHSNAHGKRYRYYISNRIKASSRPNPSAWRVPALELDLAALQFARDILSDQPQLADWIRSKCVSIDLQCAMQAAYDLREYLGVGGTDESNAIRGLADRRRILAMMFAQITIGPEAIKFLVDTNAISAMLCERDLIDDEAHEDREHHLVTM